MVHEVRLPNGLTVVAELLPEARSVALGYFVKTGARDERPEESGVSHFLEHMVFKGTEDLDALTVNLLFDRMGAQYNAFTSEEATVYYGAVLPEFGLDLLRLFTRLLRPALRPEDFALEKRVILEEIARYEDRPGFMAFQWAREAFFQGHPLGNPVLGSRESIQALTRDQMAAYHRRRYLPGNTLLALSGRLDLPRVLEEVEALTEGWEGTADRAYPPLEPKRGEEKRLYPKARQLYWVGFYPGVAFQDRRRYAAGVLAHLVGGETGRLFWALVDRGLAETASFGHEEADGAGLFYTYIQGDPKNEDPIREKVAEEFQKLKEDGVKEEEVERAKRSLATGVVFAGETPMQRLFHLGLHYLFTGTYESLEDVKARILSVSRAEVMDLLEEEFLSQGYTLLVVPDGA
ncbi:MAG: M16 family metallopeptidase [Thermaceae bacterium]